MSNKNFKEELGGPFIVRDSKNRVIYSNPLLKHDYLINNSEAKTINLFSMRFPLAIFVGAVFTVFSKNYLAAVLIALGIILVSTLIFWFVYIPRLPVLDKYSKVKGDSFIERIAKNSSKKKIYLQMALVVVLGVLTVYNAISSGYTGFTLYANLALAAGCAVYLVILLIALFKKQ